MYWQGILIGLISFAIIGIFHPVVIKSEYYWGKKCWKVFLIAGILFAIGSIFLADIFWSAISALVGFSCLWSIGEIFHQEKRVQKGWFKANPKRSGSVIVRAETPDDYDSIRRINEQAFGQLDEAFLIEKLRKNKKFNPALSLVAVKNNIIVGHILFFPSIIKTALGTEIETLALAPMSVFPSFQKQGIGSILVRKGLVEAKNLSYHSVVVLGHEKFYPGFGFQKASDYGIECPYNCPDEAFMAQELEVGALDGIQGIITYPKEFEIFGK